MSTVDLVSKAALLKASSHFVNHTDASPLSEKQQIFLVLAGKKPVSQATSCRWVKTAEGAHSEPDSHKELRVLLEDLGLAFQLRSDEYATDAFLSLDAANISSYLEAEAAQDKITIGRLFGFPDTAVEAFVHGDGMALEEQDRLIEATGLPVTTVSMPLFRLSKAHATEELNVVKDWYETLKAYDLI